MADLDILRRKIDALDREIVDRLNQRVRLASEIGRIKHEMGAPFYVPAREEQVFAKLTHLNDGPLDMRAIRSIYREIISASIAQEKRMIVAYLGPEATYTHEAAVKNFGTSLEYRPMATIPDIFIEVEKGEADYGVIPIENSTEGAVFHSLDMFVESELKIVAQIYLRIDHCLISDSPPEKIHSVYSKDQAIGQCRDWLRRHVPHAQLVEVSSTARAVQIARDTEGAAAIAGELAANLYDVGIVQTNIQDRADNYTRFLVVGLQSSVPMGQGRDKTSFVISINDEIGALKRAVEPFSSRDINLCKIESRPSRRKPWDYYFFIDVIGHFEDPPIQEAFVELKRHCPFVKWLGSYPNIPHAS